MFLHLFYIFFILFLRLCTSFSLTINSVTISSVFCSSLSLTISFQHSFSNVLLLLLLLIFLSYFIASFPVSFIYFPFHSHFSTFPIFYDLCHFLLVQILLCSPFVELLSNNNRLYNWGLRPVVIIILYERSFFFLPR